MSNLTLFTCLERYPAVLKWRCDNFTGKLRVAKESNIDCKLVYTVRTWVIISRGLARIIGHSISTSDIIQ